MVDCACSVEIQLLGSVDKRIGRIGKAPALPETVWSAAPVAEVLMHYRLYRIEDDTTITLVSEHEDLLTGIAAGKYAVEEEDYDFAYALHSDGVRLATFASGRIGYREWARRNGWLKDIHAVEDRYDKDVDELVGTKY